jgi:Protein of unknown function (DUF1416)
MCGAPAQDTVLDQTLPVSVDPATATIIQGRVTRGGDAVPAAYVRLLDGAGDFTAEVVTSATGAFRFFAAPGQWTVRALTPGGSGEQAVEAGVGFTTTEIALA